MTRQFERVTTAIANTKLEVQYKTDLLAGRFFFMKMKYDGIHECRVLNGMLTTHENAFRLFRVRRYDFLFKSKMG